MAYAPVANINFQYDRNLNYFLKFYKPSTTTPISMATDATGGTLLAKAEISNKGFPTTDGTALFIPFLNQSYDAYLFPTEEEADANDTINADRVAQNINPFSDNFEQVITYLPFPQPAGPVLLNVPDLPVGLLLFIDGDAQEQGVIGTPEDFIYDQTTGNITLTVALTGNEQVWVTYGAIVGVTSVSVQGLKVFSTIAQAKLAPTGTGSDELQAGDSFTTDGYHTVFEGAARYRVTASTGGAGQLNNIALTGSGLFAQIVPINNKITLAQAGAKFIDEGAAGFDDTALSEALVYCADNGINLDLEGKESHYYNTHQVTNTAGSGVIGFTISGAGDFTKLRNHAAVITLEFLDAHTYKNMHLKEFDLQSNAALGDTAIKIRNWFESCSMTSVFAIGHRFGFHILQSFNPSFFNCEARQGATRHDDGTDTTKSYGWWIDQSEGPINALYFFGCAAQLFWHNWFFDNTSDNGNFVSLELYGARSENAFQSGVMVEGGGAQISWFGGYNENNWRQAQLVTGGSGVLADQGVNFTIKGIVGVDDYSIYQSAVYHQISQNIKNNAPIGNIVSVFGDSTIEELNFSSVNSRHGYNDPTKVDWNFYFDDGITTLNSDITLVNSGKASNESVYVGERYSKKFLFSIFGLDNSTDLTTEPLSSFASDNATVFLSFSSATTEAFTTSPIYIIQNQAGATVGTITFEDPASALNVTAGVEYLVKINMAETGVFRFSRSVNAVGANPDFNVSILQKQIGFNSLVTYEEPV